MPPPLAGGADPPCPVCESTSLTRGRLSPSELDRVDMFACNQCGEFWFERDGSRLTAEAMRSLGFPY